MPLSRTLILLLCCCALALRMGGMHVHVGLDHEEAPHGLHADVHVGVQHADMEPELGSVLHDHHEHEDEHPDHVHKAHAEVSLDNEALTKKFGMDTGLLLLAFLAILCWLLPVSGREVRRIRRDRVTIPRCPAYLQPPLRGPPATA